MSIYNKETKQKFDAIVVGSGVSGGWAAKEFCEKGFKTLMVERGRKVEHRKDYPTEGKGPWEFPFRTRVENLLVKQNYPIQSQCYAFNDATKHFFANDREMAYSVEPGTEYSWIKGDQLGGRSLLWHRQVYRLSDYDLTNNINDGHGNDWPIRYKDIAPWYSYVEKHIGTSGSYENLPQLPDGEFLPPFEFTSPEKMIKAKIEAKFNDRRLIMGRTAHLSKPNANHIAQGRVQCQTRDECQRGCSFGAYFSTQSSTLPAAIATNNLTVATDSIVHSLIYDENKNRVIGVRVVDREDMSTREYFADVVFLCASTHGSTQIMLNSKSKTFPNGIANSSGVLGHYLMDHVYNQRATADIEGFEGEYYSGRRPTQLYMPNFYYKGSQNKKFKRGYVFAADASRKDWQSKPDVDGIGVQYKEQMSEAGPWQFTMFAQGEMLPRFENQVSLHPTKTDKWGIPQLHFNCQFSDNEYFAMEDAAEQAEKMMKAAGLSNIKSQAYRPGDAGYRAPGLNIHDLGTARMGRDPKDSVLNGYNQSHDIPNLFVTDGASYCSSGTQNPSLTFMALTARAVDYAVKEMKNRRI